MPARGQALIERGVADPSGRALVTLDAATRMTESLAAAGAVERGAPAERMVEALLEAELRARRLRRPRAPSPRRRRRPPPALGPRAPRRRTRRRAGLAAGRGAGHVRKGARPEAGSAQRLPPELAAALAEPPPPATRAPRGPARGRPLAPSRSLLAGLAAAAIGGASWRRCSSAGSSSGAAPRLFRQRPARSWSWSASLRAAAAGVAPRRRDAPASAGTWRRGSGSRSFEDSPARRPLLPEPAGLRHGAP